MLFTRHTIPNALRAALRFIRTVFSKDPVIAIAAVQSIREVRCLNCPEHFDGQCKRCTCFVALKTTLAAESCPIGKWRRQTRFSSGL